MCSSDLSGARCPPDDPAPSSEPPEPERPDDPHAKRGERLSKGARPPRPSPTYLRAICAEGNTTTLSFPSFPTAATPNSQLSMITFWNVCCVTFPT